MPQVKSLKPGTKLAKPLTSGTKPPERIVNDPFWLRRFSVAEYHKMIESGILTTDDRVELLEGWIVKKMSQNPPHSNSVRRVSTVVGKILPKDWILSAQLPITLSESEPEPDLAIARGDLDTYTDVHPTPADIGVLMEIGDSSLLTDRRYKGSLYAQEKIGEFWLINLVDRKVEVYTKPRRGKNPQYQKCVEYNEQDKVPLTLNGVKIADLLVSELLPKP